MMKRRGRFVVIDNCPVPRKLAPFVRDLKAAVPGAVLISCYRGQDAAGMLHRLGKHTQAELYYAYVHNVPGANPANPPGRSTHELFSDGTAYAGPVGRKLKWWQVGMDWDDAHVALLIEAAARRGWALFRPYSSGSEYHHLNFRVKPVRRRQHR